MSMNKYALDVLNNLSQRYPWENVFISSVEECFNSITPFLNANEGYYRNEKVLENIVEPDRIISFKVPWRDDKGIAHVNVGWRVEFNNVLGPYKGGLRFHASTDLSILKFLGFEQIFKNSLTGLSIGGGKGGSNFSPRGKSDNEIKSFCRSFMIELSKHIGANTDVPAGDIGVGGREIGYLYGSYKRLKNTFEGAITGKSTSWGGSFLRPEATGYGVVYFLNEMMKMNNDNIEGKKIAVSGFGNVAWGVVKKVTELGGKVITLSGPDGFIHDENGVCGEKIEYMLKMRYSNNDTVEDYSKNFNVKFHKDKRPWNIPCDIAIPCAIQNAVKDDDVKNMISNNVKYLVEGANQPLTSSAVSIIQNSNIIYAPGKASNAGGVACSCFEMAQNASFCQWSSKKVDKELKNVMHNIHTQCYNDAKKFGQLNDYLTGANIAGFRRVAEAMIDQGIA